MARSVMHTIWVKQGDRHFKVFKVGFGGDGSYYVTVPYHPLNTALAAKIRVNYATKRPVGVKQSLEQALELRDLQDDENRLKLAHHPDGFIQFSGTGIQSGRTATGAAKGLGVRSWKLDLPTFGPSFGVSIAAPVELGREGVPQLGEVVFDLGELEHLRMPGYDFNDVRFSGHYFPARFRSFVRSDGAGGYQMSIVNPPSNVVLPFKVVLASKSADLPGLIGLAAEPHELGIRGFTLTSSTGSVRRNTMGDLIGDQLLAIYPRMEDFDQFRLSSLNYAELPTPAYSAPPGSDVYPPPPGKGAGSRLSSDPRGQTNKPRGGACRKTKKKKR